MKSLLIVFGIFASIHASCQIKLFQTDTLGFKIDSLSMDTVYLIGEDWYLSNVSLNKDTIVFDKDHSTHHPKFEFDNTGLCYVEAGWMGHASGMDLWYKYELSNNILRFINFESNAFYDFLIGDNLIVEYNKSRLVLIHRK